MSPQETRPKTVLVGPEIEESLALRYLSAAVLQAGYRCHIVSFDRSRDLERTAVAIVREKPDLVALSLVAQRRYGDYQELIRLLRRRGYRGHVTAGGHFAGLRAAEILTDTPGLDSILHHEGERRIVDLIVTLERGDRLPAALEGISCRDARGTVVHIPPRDVLDLDKLPFPTRRRPDKTLGYPRAPIISSRGCAGACSFCSIHAWHRQARVRPLRFRSPEAVAAEMATLHEEHGVRVFVFHDDDFIHPDPRQALGRCRAIFDRAAEEVGEAFAFVLKSRPDRIEEELFGYLKSRGLARVYVGIETHARTGLETLNRRVSPEMNLHALSVLKKLGVYSCFNLLIFHPETTLDELDENLRFLEEHRDHPFDIARTELYARSTLETRLLEEGRAVGDYRGYSYRITDPRAETLFRLWADLLWDRHFGEPSILQRSQELGFRLSLLRHFEPALFSPELETRVGTFIRDVNGDTVEFLRRLEQAVRRGVAEDLRTELAADVSRRGRAQAARWAALSLELEARAALGRAGWGDLTAAARLPRFVWRLASTMPALALALAPMGCNQVCDPPPPPARFSTNIEPLLDETCATAGCHTAADSAAGLVLETGVSYEELVGPPSRQLPSMPLVKPGDPDSSYLQRKLDGTHLTAGGEGDRMPPPPEGPAAELADRVRTWIYRGAKND